MPFSPNRRKEAGTENLAVHHQPPTKWGTAAKDFYPDGS
jgi:hypothetical protein